MAHDKRLALTSASAPEVFGFTGKRSDCRFSAASNGRKGPVDRNRRFDLQPSWMSASPGCQPLRNPD